ncbi:MAG: hypothetical protein K8R69_00785 [Deltaproteobacteria bacterium]|nr:hypothetical protein [Deltaproteobacteria bacterium]
MRHFPDNSELEFLSIRELVDKWEVSEIELFETQSRIEQILNMALTFGDREFKESISSLVAEKHSILKFIEQVIFYLRRKAKQIPYESH